MRLKNIASIGILALALYVTSVPAAAQQGKTSFVGILSTGHPRSRPVWVAFVQRLRELEYVEGKNLKIEFRNARGQADRAPGLAAELVSLGADVIVAAGAESTLQAARQATGTIPIVMVAVDYNPLARGYIGSLSRPGGNLTGVVFQQESLTTKRLELLREAVPAVTPVAVFWDVISAGQFEAAEAAAKTLGVTLLPRELSEPPYDFARAFDDLTRIDAKALMVLQSPLMSKPEQGTVPDLALKHRLPAIFGSSRYADLGGLMSYGPKFDDIFRRAADYVDRVLQGTPSGELPVERPTAFELVINLSTAKVLGLTIPPSILYRADKVIQ